MPVSKRRTNKQKISKGPNVDRAAVKASGNLKRGLRQMQINAINTLPRGERSKIAKQFIRANQRKT